jgi:hypothetical protein
VQDAAGEVDVLPEQRAQLAHAQPGVHRGGPERAIVVEGRQQRRRLLARGDAVAAAAYGGEFEAERRVDRDLPAGDRAAHDGAQRDQRVPDRRRVVVGQEQAVDEVLDGGPAQVGQADPPSSGSTRSRMACS